MNRFQSKIFSLITLVSLVFTQPMFVFAQTDTDSPVTMGAPIVEEPTEPSQAIPEESSEEVAVVKTETEEVSSSEASTEVEVSSIEEEAVEEILEDDSIPVSQSDPSTDLLQNTFNTQDVLDPADIDSSEDIDISVLPETEEATSDELTDATLSDGVAVDVTPTNDIDSSEEEGVIEEVQPSPEEIFEPTPQSEAPVVRKNKRIVISLKEIEPTPDYVISVKSGKRISTVKKVRTETRDRANNIVVTESEETITAVPVITADNSKGVMDISGSCTNTYYVVLVYKEETDYEHDRSSYIVNRAFPCESGSFSYKIENLPSTLQNGTYYVLIGEQGDTGPWSPITALTEVDLVRSTSN